MIECQVPFLSHLAEGCSLDILPIVVLVRQDALNRISSYSPLCQVKLRIPVELLSSSSDRIQSKITFLFGENLTSFVISKATSSAVQHIFDCFMVLEMAKLSAWQ